MATQFKQERAEKTAEMMEQEHERQEQEKKQIREMLKKNKDRVLEIQ
jgi:hypothetical protein